MRRMKLQTYMTKKRLDDTAFGEIIGKDRTMVSKYRRGKVVPPLEIIAKIEDATARKVSFRDFIEAAQ